MTPPAVLVGIEVPIWRGESSAHQREKSGPGIYAHRNGYRKAGLRVVEADAAGSDDRLLAHSDGKVVGVHVSAGETVGKGQTLIVLEAMKMEFQLALPVGGRIKSVHVRPGR